MAQNGSTTVTTTRTVVGTNEIRSSLHAIAGELERVRSALDTTSLQDLVRSLRDLELRITTIEETTLSAASDVDDARRELDRERERFQQLWAAYKTQEDELSELKSQLGLANANGRTVEELRSEVVRLRNASERAAEGERALRENQALRIEVENQNRILREAQNTLDRQSADLVALRQTATRVTLLETVDKDLEIERERLAKLYKVYEERAADIRDLNTKLQNWEAWFQRMEPHMSQICRMTGDAPRV